MYWAMLLVGVYGGIQLGLASHDVGFDAWDAGMLGGVVLVVSLLAGAMWERKT